MNRILLLGANGQVGRELHPALAPLGGLVVCDRRRADLADPEGLVSCTHLRDHETLANLVCRLL
ncbi:NAD(P)-dependent oxidoreductase, partial [Pseudomonas aeruginosa]|nr:NAD(P)-dependent oxidoreductase [Pseudomonas aeruginosa]